MQKRSKTKKGFTLIEVLVVIGIIAILAGVVLVAVNPARQFAMARDSQRTSNVNAILNAIGQNIAEHKGNFVCGNTAVGIPAESTLIRSKNAEDGGIAMYPGDLASCLVPDYISSLPFDPQTNNGHYASPADYDTGYEVSKDANGRVTVKAFGELQPSIAVTR